MGESQKTRLGKVEGRDGAVALSEGEQANNRDGQKSQRANSRFGRMKKTLVTGSTEKWNLGSFKEKAEDHSLEKTKKMRDRTGEVFEVDALREG